MTQASSASSSQYETSMSLTASGVMMLAISDSTPGLPVSSRYDSLGSLVSALILALLWGNSLAQR
eukprot:11436180-Heterocapsa_arctica.AAC.1